MSRLTIIDFRTMEKLLLRLSSKREAMFSTVMPMAAQPLSQIIPAVIWPGR